MNLEATGTYVNKGFPMKLPLSDLNPHPFVARDVQQEDWLRFVGDIVTVGQLTPMEDIPPVLWCCLAGLIGRIYFVVLSFTSVIQILSSTSCYRTVLQKEI